MGDLTLIAKLRAAQAENRLLRQEAIKAALQHMWDTSEIRFLNGYIVWLGHCDDPRTKPVRGHDGTD